MQNRLTQESLARYIPDLWRYGVRLCADDEKARVLICDTLDTALQKQWKRPASLTVGTWLNMLMYRVFLADYGRYSVAGNAAIPGNGSDYAILSSLSQNMAIRRFDTVH